MTQREFHPTALLGGIALTFLALWLQPAITNTSMNVMVGGGAFAFAAAASTKVIVQLLLIVPGLLVGWVAKTRGVPLGAFAGLIGALIYSMFFGPAAQIPPHPYLPNPWSWAIGDALSQSMIAGVAGGTGQLLRSDKSLERTRAG